MENSKTVLVYLVLPYICVSCHLHKGITNFWYERHSQGAGSLTPTNRIIISMSSGGIYSLLQALNYPRIWAGRGEPNISFPRVFFFRMDAEKYLLIDLT
jgi:hypothetical protein